MKDLPAPNSTKKDILFGVLFAFLALFSLVLTVQPVRAKQETPTDIPTGTLTQTASLSPQDEITPSPSVSQTKTTASKPTHKPKATGTPTPAVTPSITVSPAPTATSPEVETLPGNYVDDEILVKFKSRTVGQSIDQCLLLADTTVESRINALGVLLLKIPAGKVSEMVARMRDCPDLEYAEPNYLAQVVDVIPNDPYYASQYGLAAIRAPQGWGLSSGSSAVTIAVVDSGVDFAHLDLSTKLVPGYDFANGDNFPQDDNGHGTHVAGIAAASSDNGLGVSGVSWGARIMPVKVLNAAGNGTFANVAAGIVWAADNGAQVINLSLGGSSSSATLQNAVDYAYGKGLVIVAASGNSGSNFVLYPARYPHVIAVAATDSSNARASFSNYGPEVDLSAPGVSIYSTVIGGYGYNSGTSMSAPFVSGLAAVLRGLPGNASPDAIEAEMESSALDLGSAGRDDFYGAGLIQMDAAIQLVLPPTLTSTPTLTASLTLTPTESITPTPSLTATPGPSTTFQSTATPSRTPERRKVTTATPRPWIVFPPILLFPSETPTLTPTVTVTQPTSAATTGPTSTFLPTPTQPKSETAKLGEIQAQADAPDDLLLPCLGGVFILAGLLLAWVTLRLQRQSGG